MTCQIVAEEMCILVVHYHGTLIKLSLTSPLFLIILTWRHILGNAQLWRGLLYSNVAVVFPWQVSVRVILYLCTWIYSILQGLYTRRSFERAAEISWSSVYR